MKKKLELRLKCIRNSSSGKFKHGNVYKVKIISAYPDGMTFLDVYNELGELSILDTYMIGKDKLFVWVS